MYEFKTLFECDVNVMESRSHVLQKHNVAHFVTGKHYGSRLLATQNSHG